MKSIPDDICGTCYHPKKQVGSCRHPNCTNRKEYNDPDDEQDIQNVSDLFEELPAFLKIQVE